MALLLATAYQPPVRYMAAAVSAQELVIEIHETYPKQTCRNHCTILGPNGPQTLTIPVSRVNGNHTPTRDIRISDHEPWQQIHWRSIETAYRNAPFFLYYGDEIAPFYRKRFSFLVDLNSSLLETYLRILRSERPVSATTRYEKSAEGVADCLDDLVSKHDRSGLSYPHYTQVFEPVTGFIPGLSILDALFNLGPETTAYLQQIK